MNLPQPSETYSRENEARTRAEIDRADKQNLKRGQDIELVGTRVIGTSPDGNKWVLGVDNAGAPVWTLLA